MQLKKTDPSKFKQKRTPMKAVNFGLIYKMGVPTLHTKLLTQGYPIEETTAERYHTTWKQTFPDIQKYHARCDKFYNSHIHSVPELRGFKYITSVAGRLPLRGRRPVLTQCSDGVTRPILETTKLVNFAIQGTCSDYLKTAVRLLHHYIYKNNLPARIVLTAHDEIVVDSPKYLAKHMAELLEDIMVVAAQKITHPILSNAPIEVDVAIGDSDS